MKTFFFIIMISFSLDAQFVDSRLNNYGSLLLNSDKGNRYISEMNSYSKMHR